MKGWQRGCLLLGVGLGAQQFLSSSLHGSGSLRLYAQSPSDSGTTESTQTAGSLPFTLEFNSETVPAHREHEPAQPLRLRFVQVITRHGLRTPFTTLPGDDSDWRCDHQQLSMMVKTGADGDDTKDSFLMLHSDEPMPQDIPSHYLFTREFIEGRQSLKGNCYKGQLTSAGLLQMKKLGEELRQRYVHTLRLLSPVYEPKEVYLRSSNSNRTIESAQSLMWGFFPPHENARAKDNGVMVINMIESRVENMYPRSRCKKLTKLKNDAKKSEDHARHLKKIEPVKEEIEKVLGRSVDSWSSLNSTLKSMEAHGFGLPKGVTKEMALKVEKESGWHTARKYDSTLAARLGIGSFIADVLHNMDVVVKEPASPLRFALFSGHDNTLSPFLSAFKVLDGKQPDMATAIVIEQYEDAKGQFWVRMVYRGKDILLPTPEQMPHLDGWRNVKKWNAHNARLGIVDKATKEVTLVVPQGNNTHNTHNNDNNTHNNLRKERMILCPFEDFKALAAILIPVDYKKECEIDN